ncbi:MAG TPA: HEPN domain-containing protein [Atribacteraceae bacterium]|nr:HEPN domain-containing protein [Atribacteraceae bacterium]
MNKKLARDYYERVLKRKKAILTLYQEEAYADVVREVQETVELLLKGILLQFGLEVPKLHDVGGIFRKHESLFPHAIRMQIARISTISKDLRRDRELAFYGAHDVVPSEYYTLEDAEKALGYLEEILQIGHLVFGESG